MNGYDKLSTKDVINNSKTIWETVVADPFLIPKNAHLMQDKLQLRIRLGMMVKCIRNDLTDTVNNKLDLKNTILSSLMRNIDKLKRMDRHVEDSI